MQGKQVCEGFGRETGQAKGINAEKQKSRKDNKKKNKKKKK